MKPSTKILRAILEQQNIGSNDILYALEISNTSINEIALDCSVSPKFIYDVISNKRRSFDIATYIADKLNTTTTRLWGDAYNYTPRKPAAVRRLVSQF